MSEPDHRTGRNSSSTGLEALDKGLVVSCQARAGTPLRDSNAMAMMAAAAEQGGACGLRVNGVDDIRAVQQVSSLPIMGINKVEYEDSPVIITPTVVDALTVLETGVPFVALDGTNRRRPRRESLVSIIETIHQRGALALADLATREDLGGAIAAGANAVGTTLSGYTEETATESDAPDLDLLAWLVERAPVPVFAEGRYWTPEQAAQALAIGATFVVVGTAITNPMAITRRFVNTLHRASNGRAL